MKQVEESYKIFSCFYDAYTKDFKADLPLYENLCRDSRKILEIGCGTGRILKALYDEDKIITGIDVSSDMLEIAGNKLKEYIDKGNLKLIQYDFSLSPINEKFDAILITWYTFNYIINTPELFIKNLLFSLNDNGFIVIDLFYPKTMKNTKLNDVWTEKEIDYNGNKIIINDKRKVENNIEERIQIYKTDDLEETVITKRRYFSKREMHDMLTKLGIDEIYFIDGYDVNTKCILSENEVTDEDYVCFFKNR
jgi:SAM-dependent methyltransferase